MAKLKKHASHPEEKAILNSQAISREKELVLKLLLLNQEKVICLALQEHL